MRHLSFLRNGMKNVKEGEERGKILHHRRNLCSYSTSTTREREKEKEFHMKCFCPFENDSDGGFQARHLQNENKKIIFMLTEIDKRGDGISISFVGRCAITNDCTLRIMVGNFSLFISIFCCLVIPCSELFLC